MLACGARLHENNECKNRAWRGENKCPQSSRVESQGAGKRAINIRVLSIITLGDKFPRAKFI
jgi:hypothetical protein